MKRGAPPFRTPAAESPHAVVMSPAESCPAAAASSLHHPGPSGVQHDSESACRGVVTPSPPLGPRPQAFCISRCARVWGVLSPGHPGQRILDVEGRRPYIWPPLKVYDADNRFIGTMGVVADQKIDASLEQQAREGRKANN